MLTTTTLEMYDVTRICVHARKYKSKRRQEMTASSAEKETQQESEKGKRKLARERKSWQRVKVAALLPRKEDSLFVH